MSTSSINISPDDAHREREGLHTVVDISPNDPLHMDAASSRNDTCAAAPCFT
jgi:hypothetical protein